MPDGPDDEATTAPASAVLAAAAWTAVMRERAEMADEAVAKAVTDAARAHEAVERAEADQLHATAWAERGTVSPTSGE